MMPMARRHWPEWLAAATAVWFGATAYRRWRGEARRMVDESRPGDPPDGQWGETRPMSCDDGGFGVSTVTRFAGNN